MTYEESAALMADPAFRSRIKVAAVKYADAILIEAASTPAHNTRLGWSKTTLQQPDMAALQLHPPVVLDAAVQASGAAATDAELQGAVEATVNKSF